MVKAANQDDPLIRTCPDVLEYAWRFDGDAPSVYIFAKRRSVRGAGRVDVAVHEYGGGDG